MGNGSDSESEERKENMMTTEYIAASDIDSKMTRIAHLIAELNDDVSETQRLTLLSFCEDDADGETEATVRGYLMELGTDCEQIDESDIAELIIGVLDDYKHESTNAEDDFDNSKFETILRLCSECYVGTRDYYDSTSVH
jgi:hypothetical protein